MLDGLIEVIEQIMQWFHWAFSQLGTWIGQVVGDWFYWWWRITFDVGELLRDSVLETVTGAIDLSGAFPDAAWDTWSDIWATANWWVPFNECLSLIGVYLTFYGVVLLVKLTLRAIPTI
jgi:hypothetical protein